MSGYSGGEQGLRAPNTLPICLDPKEQQKILLAQKGMGRGRGVVSMQQPSQRPGGMSNQPPAGQMSPPNQQKVAIPPHPLHTPYIAKIQQEQQQGYTRTQQSQQTLQQAVAKAQEPHQQYQAEQEQQAKYIPGLPGSKVHSTAPVNPYQPLKKAPKKIDQELVQMYSEGRKHPISAVMEFAAATRKTATFDEVSVANPSLLGQFAYVCRFDGRTYPQGDGKTKKDAKTKAAKNTFDILVGFSTDPYEEGNTVDHIGRIVQGTFQQTPYNAPGPAPGAMSAPSFISQPPVNGNSAEQAEVKHPVMLFGEICQKKGLQVTFDVGEKSDTDGFRTTVYIGNVPLASSTALNKKDSKKKKVPTATLR